MNMSSIAGIALPFAFLAFALAFLAATFQPGIFRFEPRRTIERVDHALIHSSPSEADMSKALRFLEFVASSDQDVSGVASDTGALFERRITLADKWTERLGRFADEEGTPAPHRYEPNLPAGDTPLDAIARARAWIFASPSAYEASESFDSARAALKAGLDPTPALAQARAILARHAISVRSALDELETIR